jgi:hypothetical protein
MVFQEGSSNGLKGIPIPHLRLISFWIEHTQQSLFSFQFYGFEIMSPQTFERRLTAILSADVVGYSRLMRDDEDLTFRTLTGRREMMATLKDHNNGRVVDSTGDNLLAEFFSVTQAVDCAVEIQRELAERNAELPEERRVDYRIGVNLGDTCCIMGNVPISLMATGTAGQVNACCQDLIDYCGRGGGFILAPSTQIDDGREETIRALIDFPKSYMGKS